MPHTQQSLTRYTDTEKLKQKLIERFGERSDFNIVVGHGEAEEAEEAEAEAAAPQRVLTQLGQSGHRYHLVASTD